MNKWYQVAMLVVGLSMIVGNATAGGKHGGGTVDCSQLPPGQAKKHPGCGGGKKGGPPPWAPAHGHRGKGEHGYVVEDPAVSIRIGEEVGISVGTCRREVVGAILGGVVGGVVGNRVGEGDDKPLTTVAGAVIGVLIGKSIGKQMDDRDQQCTGQALERVEDGKMIRWTNDRGVEFKVTPQSTFTSQEGLFCRSYVTVSTEKGAVKSLKQSACRSQDGTWRQRENKS